VTFAISTRSSYSSSEPASSESWNASVMVVAPQELEGPLPRGLVVVHVVLVGFTDEEVHLQSSYARIVTDSILSLSKEGCREIPIVLSRIDGFMCGPHKGPMVLGMILWCFRVSSASCSKEGCIEIRP